ncbi:MAG TPA: metallophosphoesterase, partial [Steroidobacteraceae bacterium]|nr:metallophosphoesterase [Steroidobacteraceae bacterium]
MKKYCLTVMIGASVFIAIANCYASIAVYAVGDIAQCDGGVKKAVANKTSAMIPDNAMVVTLGDSVYPLATTKYLNSCYTPTWGRHLDYTLAVPGNHDYVGGRLTDFAKYFGTHTDAQGYFARHIGKWLFIGLDSNQRGERMTQQMTWLKQTLASESKGVTCIAAFWHHALFSSGLHSGDGDQMRAAWQMLYDYHADIVMSGHEHFYERFEPYDARGTRDANGIRE